MIRAPLGIIMWAAAGHPHSSHMHIWNHSGGFRREREGAEFPSQGQMRLWGRVLGRLCPGLALSEVCSPRSQRGSL